MFIILLPDGDRAAVLPVRRDVVGAILEQRRRERKYPLDLDSMTLGYGPELAPAEDAIVRGYEWHAGSAFHFARGNSEAGEDLLTRFSRN